MLSLLLMGALSTQAQAGARVGGYVRVMARPSLQGGAGQLGHWNLYGRLMNEGPYACSISTWTCSRQPQAQQQHGRGCTPEWRGAA